jgi:hypothetical protein
VLWVKLSYYNDNKLIFMKLKNKYIEAFIIRHFFDGFMHENNGCDRINKTTLSYNYHYPYPYYKSMIAITSLSTLLLLSFISTPAILTANASMSNNLSIGRQQQQITGPSSLQINRSNNDNSSANIQTAQSVYTSQSMTLPSSVGTFVWYIVNEAHENSATERHKYLSDSNAIYLPTNLVIAQGTAISFLNADAPWDSPHPHTINIFDSSEKIVYSSGKMDYTNSSTPKVLPSGKYTVMDTKYTWMKGNLTVTPQSRSGNGSLIMGGFYTTTSQVANNKDNDGGVHPGWLGYYRTEFPKNGFKILSEYNFHYANCKYCPGGYWPDQKTGDHTLIIYSTSQPILDALSKLSKMVWNNVYI